MRLFPIFTKFLLLQVLSFLVFQCASETKLRHPKIDNKISELQKTVAMQDSTSIQQKNQTIYSIQEIQVELNHLNNRLKSITAKSDSADWEFLSRIAILENKLETLRNSYKELISFDKQSFSDEQPKITYEEYKNLYKGALALYYNGDYREAVSDFSNLISIDAGNDYSDNCQYWIAESFYAQKEFKRSIVEFEKVFTFAGTNKSDSAQLKIGMCYLNVGDVVRAKVAFQRLLDFYPNSNSFSQAKRYLSEF